MKKTERSQNPLSGLLLYAKKSGITSFSSLWNIKHALSTEKVGHTGTLDSFADGLLVVLTGSLTHIVPHITGFAKTYKAVVCFGKETDTLDPNGKIISTKKAVTKEEVEAVLPQFTGALMQRPPAYSALHVDGKRASDLVRSGEAVQLEERAVFIYSLALTDFLPASEKDPCSYALLEITCSKGTYIRSLARDIAKALNSAAFVLALRRTAVGPFKLEDAADADSLPDFTISNALKKWNLKEEKKGQRDLILEQKIQNAFMFFTPQLAFDCGFDADILKDDYYTWYTNGRALASKMFVRLPKGPEYTVLEEEAKQSPLGLTALQVTRRLKTDRIAVFYESGDFAGMISCAEKKLSYAFVVQKAKALPYRQISWQEVVQGNFPLEWRKKGCALTVGSFDGVHLGHQALLDSVLAQKNLYKGLVTFTNSVRSSENNYEGDVLSLRQKLSLVPCNFAIVIDFSEDFSRIEGSQFIRMLIQHCGMRFLAEGNDFKCGYKAGCTVDTLKTLSKDLGFEFNLVDDVIVEGERVSSSRIRQAVKQADFVLAQKLLGRPYAYDTSALAFTQEKESAASAWMSATLTGQQVLPHDGMYTVTFSLDGSVVKTACSISDGGKTLHLLVKDEAEAKRIQELTFVSLSA